MFGNKFCRARILRFGDQTRLQQVGPCVIRFLLKVDDMKQGIHPEYKVATITCACGQVVETRSTAGNIHVEICSNCHPFFTGKQKLLDSAGRVDKFRKKYGLKNTLAEG
jgi:large subunit ribosomal protein L31